MIKEPAQIKAGIGLTNITADLNVMFGGSFVLSELAEHPNESLHIASIGAGTGHFEFLLSQALMNHGKIIDLTLIDQSPEMCDVIKADPRNKNIQPHIFREDLISWIKNTQIRYDCIILRNVTHFLTIPEYTTLLSNLKNVTKDGALIYILTLSTLHRLSLDSKDVTNHDNCLQQKKITGGINIPDNTSMTFVEISSAPDYFANETGLQLLKVEPCKYPIGSIISNGKPHDPDAITIFLKK